MFIALGLADKFSFCYWIYTLKKKFLKWKIKPYDFIFLDIGNTHKYVFIVKSSLTIKSKVFKLLVKCTFEILTNNQNK